MVAMDENIVLKTDRRGRVHTPREQQEQAVAEWERSGLSARRFAEMAGVKSDLRGLGGAQAQGGRICGQQVRTRSAGLDRENTPGSFESGAFD